MIPRADITAWRAQAPWSSNEQVEQDLIISRALVELYSHELIQKTCAFRGGTAIHKLYMAPQPRYSEDIDLVQIDPQPIGEVLNCVREQLTFLGTPRIIQKNRNNTLVFICESEIPPVVPIKLKIEINCREHIIVNGLQRTPFKIASRWFNGESTLTTYSLEELLGSKLRALYQRKKGRDLFDLWYCLANRPHDDQVIIRTFVSLMENTGHSITQRAFIANMNYKLNDPDFSGDLTGLLRVGTPFDLAEAWRVVADRLISKLA